MNTTPDFIDSLQPNEIFVFGSNILGYHAGGAALTALGFGAVRGQAEGLQGQTYAIPTDFGIQGQEDLSPYINRFLQFANSHPELHFLVTRIGCGIAGNTDEMIAPYFREALAMDNVSLHNAEVRMEPLNKAVYFLFLRHPEGIAFKCLTDYRAELTSIYQLLKPNGLTSKVQKSIDDLADPLHNSINEKCSRIRQAFTNVVGEELAAIYVVDGNPGEPRRIALSPALVKWEQNAAET